MESIRNEIQKVINANRIVLTKNSMVYHSNTSWRRNPENYPKFYGPYETAKYYLKNNNENISRKNIYQLHKYVVTRDTTLLNFTANPNNSAQITHLLDLITQLIPYTSISREKKEKDLGSVQVIALFSHILFGLNTRYNEAQINHLVEDLASGLTYPKQRLGSDFVKQLLQIIKSPCQPSRISFGDYDKMLLNALTFVIEDCQLPIDGIGFVTTGYRAGHCCKIVNTINPQWETCVPSEYILFRPMQSISYVGSDV
jgi:hypothetical protein